MQEHFIPLDAATKLALSLGVGLFAGFEREWSRKDVGVRTFALTALLGTLSSLVSVQFSLAALGAVILVIALVNGRALLSRQNLEITTSVSLAVDFVLGVLIGQGHVFTPVAAALLLTLILSLKSELSSFAGGLRPEEIRSAVLLGLIGFVIYPLLPDRFIDPWQLINPRESWITVIVIAAIGFINYVLLRLYSDRGLLYTAILGGLVNSTATIAELASWLREPSAETERTGTFFNFVTVVAMFARNLVLLAIFARQAVTVALLPIIAMSCCAATFVWFTRGSSHPAGELKLSSPVSIRKLVSFGTLFLLIEVAGAIGKRFLGRYGVVIVSLAGGLVSSASTTAAAAILAAHGETTAYTAGVATVVTSIASALSNLPVIYRVTRNIEMTRGLVVKTTAIVLVGAVVLLVQYRLNEWRRRLTELHRPALSG
jgi:uncharacterized membrane protein (DUF4010 family)